MDASFKLLNSDPNQFFDILPLDWQSLIVPFWSNYKDSEKIYGIEENGQIIGGGIVFKTCPPDILYFKEEAELWFKDGYHYLGFIWIAEEKRGKNFGSFWLAQLRTIFPKQSYWLLIEEDHLHQFYRKNGFVLERTIMHDDIKEWLYSYTPLTV